MHGNFLQDLRNTAIVAIARDTGLRTSEVAGLDVADLDVETDGSGRLNLQKSKTDQEDRGAVQTLAPSTIRCVQAWLEAAGLRSGPLFCSLRRDGHCTKERLSARSIWNIIADHAADAGAEDRPHVRPDRGGDQLMGVQICFNALDIDLQHIEDIRAARNRPELSASQIIRAALQSFAEREVDRVVVRRSYRESPEPTESHVQDDGLATVAAVEIGRVAGYFRVALSRRFQVAAEAGKRSLEIMARDLHREIGGYPGTKHQMPLCCEIMEAEMRKGDVVVTRPRVGYGARFVIRYRIPRSE